MDITHQTIRVDGRTLAAAAPTDTPQQSADAARALLKGMRADLVDGNGRVRPGYLRIRSGNGERHLEAQSRWRWGAKTDATRLVQSLVNTAYVGKFADEGARTRFTEALQNYLRQSGNRMGTQSFVRLVNTLEAIAPDHSALVEGQAAAPLPAVQSALTPRARLDLEPVARLSLSTLDSLASDNGTFGAGRAPLVGYAQSQMTALTNALDRSTNPFRQHASRLFHPLLAPPRLNPPGLIPSQTAPAQHVVGDADGSLCRVLVAAMASGHLSLSPAGLTLLAGLMCEEAKALSDGDLAAFQADQGVADRFDALLDEMQAHPSADGRRLIFLGDLLHDRLSNNKPALGQVIERLAGNQTARADGSPGVVFILGNHDVFDEVSGEILQDPTGYLEANPGGKSEIAALRAQNGFNAAKGLTAQASNELNQRCFRRAWFDAELGVFYSHNGVYKDGDNYVTGIGRFRADSPGQLAARMNAAVIQAAAGHFTHFRPEEAQISDQGLGSVPINGEDRPVFQAHGHNGALGTYGRSINLNARQQQGRQLDWAPIGAVLNLP